MNFFNKNNKEQPSRTEKINEDRKDMKLTLAVKLYNKGCSEDEVKEVLTIIENAENEIQIIKKNLVGTNISPDINADVVKPLDEGVHKIRQIQKEMQEELNEALKRILSGK